MHVRIAARARRDLLDITAYIASEDVRAAEALYERFVSLIDTLAEQPMMGRPGRVAGTRELVLHHSYLIAYRVTDEAVEIIHVRHAARRWPSGFPDEAPEA